MAFDAPTTKRVLTLSGWMDVPCSARSHPSAETASPSNGHAQPSADAEFERAKAAYEAGKSLPPHQRAELLSDLMDACDALDAEAA